jgi:serine protease Do
MNLLHTSALAAGFVVAAGAGAAWSPVAHAQRTPRPHAQTRVMQWIGGEVQIGVSIHDADAGAAQPGVVVDSVEEDSPAAKAGVKEGDVFTQFDGERVRSARQFTRLVRETPAGRQVPATVMRDGRSVSLSITPEGGESAFRYAPAWRELGDRLRSFDFPEPPEAPEPPATPAPPEPPAPPRVLRDFDLWFGPSSGRLGVSVEDVTPQLAEYFGVKDGVLVRSVTKDSVAAKAGIKAGDVITSINETTVENASELRRALRRLDDNAEFSIAIVRDKKTMTLKGKLEARSTTRRTVA